MFVWLASYPKSGNTLVRSMLAAYFFSNDGIYNFDLIKNIKQFPNITLFENLGVNIKNEKEIIKNYIKVQQTFNKKNSVQFLKTHSYLFNIDNYAFTDLNNSLGVIYIVRDPRNVITSIKNHYNKDTFSKALEFIKNEKQLLGDLKDSKLETDLPTVISSWKNHYNSWKKIKTNYLLIKYENLLNKPEEEFFKITDFLEKLSNFKFKKDDIIKSIKATSFDNLKNQERKKGFKEASKDKFGNPIKFFNLGPENNWYKLLDKKIINSIEESFKNEMIDLGYL